LWGWRNERFRKIWVRTYGEAGWKNAVVGFVKYRSNRSHASNGGIICVMCGSSGNKTGYLIPAEYDCVGGEGIESHDGDPSSGECPPKNPDNGDAALCWKFIA
jgi:hypothetical protein